MSKLVFTGSPYTRPKADAGRRVRAAKDHAYAVHHELVDALVCARATVELTCQNSDLRTATLEDIDRVLKLARGEAQ